jgi:hypothetical protein
MVRTGLEERVKSLEESSQLIRSVPGRLDRIEARLDDVPLQILQSREELTVVIHATADALKRELRTEMHAIRDELRAEMRAEIRSSSEETRRHMAVLLEHAVAQMHALFDASRQPPQ